MNYIGIDVGGTNLKAGLVSESGELLATTKMKIASISNQEMLVRTMVDMTGELAEKVGVTVRTIQYYDQENLLKPSAKGSRNQRLIDMKATLREGKIVFWDG